MADDLLVIYSKLVIIKEYICKLGEKRRIGPSYDVRINEAKELFHNFEHIIKITSPLNITKEFLEISINIRKVYSSIIHYSTPKMATNNKESFCLKTAVSLLPKMNGSESVTQDLIDAIDLYSSMLDGDSRKPLIDFVLKTRLSSSAKMRLNSAYGDVNSLLSDMRTHLLTRKSDTALQSKLQNIRQGNRSIKDFGAEVERLFVDLTISQSDGKEDVYKILTPINEKNAIKRFADGLQSQKLSTIITARNFLSLKDAIRAAEDESSVPAPQIMSYNRSYQNRSRGSFVRYGTPSRIFNRGNHTQNFHNLYNNGNQLFRSSQQRPVNRTRTSSFRSQQFRGRQPSRNNYVNRNKNNSMNYFVENNDLSSSDNQTNDMSCTRDESNFFRP